MTRIREAVERIDPQQLQTANANVLATAVEQDVAYMVSNCRLEPEPDAALHLLIGRMMAFEMSMSFWSDIAFGEIADKLGADRASELIPSYPSAAPVVGGFE